MELDNHQWKDKTNLFWTAALEDCCVGLEVVGVQLEDEVLSNAPGGDRVGATAAERYLRERSHRHVLINQTVAHLGKSDSNQSNISVNVLECEAHEVRTKVIEYPAKKSY